LHSLTEILTPFKGARIVEWFIDLSELWHNTGPIEPEDHHSPKGMTQWIHYNNFTLWHLEDDARRSDVDASEIVSCKRKIDKYNQQRNDAIERIDIWIENVLENADIQPDKDTEMNSETPASIIDRMSIVCLKIYHMNEEIQRDDVDKEHKKVAGFRLAILNEQRDDLSKALDKLMLDLRQAKKRHKVYRQFKMYNDPRFNPSIYKSKKK